MNKFFLLTLLFVPSVFGALRQLEQSPLPDFVKCSEECLPYVRCDKDAVYIDVDAQPGFRDFGGIMVVILNRNGDISPRRMNNENWRERNWGGCAHKKHPYVLKFSELRDGETISIELEGIAYAAS